MSDKKFDKKTLESFRDELLKAKDPEKDQSYSLSFLSQEQLSHMVLPLGDCTKKEICRMAQEQGYEYDGSRGLFEMEYQTFERFYVPLKRGEQPMLDFYSPCKKKIPAP